MPVQELVRWLDVWTRSDTIWYAKRLAANDTLASNAHQAGPYVPKQFLFSVFPSINKPTVQNPERRFPLFVDSHEDQRDVRAIWYNNKLLVIPSLTGPDVSWSGYETLS